MSERTDALTLWHNFMYFAPYGLIQASTDGRIERINPPATRWLTALNPQAELTNVFDCLRRVAPRLAESGEWFTAPSGVVYDQLPVVFPTDSNRVESLSLSLLKIDEQTIIICLNEASTPVSSGQARLLNRAHPPAAVDAANELPDQQVLVSRLDELLRKRNSRRALAALAVQFEELDHQNEAFGSVQRNDLINAVGSRLSNQIYRLYRNSSRPMTAPVVGRLGSDQFVVLFGEAPPCVLLESSVCSLTRSLAEPYQIGAQEVRTRLYAGLAFYAEGVQTLSVDSVLQEVDTAVQRARESGPSPRAHCQLFTTTRGQHGAVDAAEQSYDPHLALSRV